MASDEDVDRVAEALDKEGVTVESDNFVERLATLIDEEATNRESGGLFNLAGCYKLDEDRRIARKLANLGHFHRALAYARESGETARVERMQKELDLLAPFWTGDTTKEQAVAECERHKLARALAGND